MNLTVLCVFYPPINSSAAIQINHLVEELAIQGHSIEVITPDSSIKKSCVFESKKNLKIPKSIPTITNEAYQLLRIAGSEDFY